MQVLVKKDFCKDPLTSDDKSFDYEEFIEELPLSLQKELELYDALWESLYGESLSGSVIEVDFESWEKDIALSLANIVKDVDFWVNSYNNTTKRWGKQKILPY